ncbi:MAG: hypothetical protein DRP08_07460 [Candidatus Aenigmatarchaeota archaeon]|nr:MAG: hypothetical protein DRP08_07460 [Candidatus Aenigmarchaeota archaeon]
MRTPSELYTQKPIVYSCELKVCPECGGQLKVAYVSGRKTVQTMTNVMTIAQKPKYCAEPSCKRYQKVCKSAQWQQIAPLYSIYGYDVIVQIGWQRQTCGMQYSMIHSALKAQLQISESQVRHLYHERYLPLLACHERQYLGELKVVAERSGLILSLDGLAPEGGEAQLWVVREMQTGLTLRSGWMSGQDQEAFKNLLLPIRDSGLCVTSVISDKQRGLVLAIAAVFPEAKHAFCQMHYLKNAAAPVAEADQTMKVALRKEVRDKVGNLVRQEKREQRGVLTVTGLFPSPIEPEPQVKEEQTIKEGITQERAAIVQDLKRRVRYLLTLKGRPPFRLAGIEMFERLTEVETCLETLLQHYAAPQLIQLQTGLHFALQSVQSDYTNLRQAADWLERISLILDPQVQPLRSGEEVRQELLAYLDDIEKESHDIPCLQKLYQKIRKTTLSYSPGLFHCYDIPSLPRTNNDRESEFRDLNRRLLRTTGQNGLVRRIILRQGAWEVIPHPDSFRDTVTALSQVDQEAFYQERQRIRTHRDRFRLHTRSAKQSRKQLEQLVQRWTLLPPLDSS